MSQKKGPVTFREWVEGFGYRVVRVEFGRAPAPIVVTRGKHLVKDGGKPYVDRDVQLDGWVVFEEDDLKRWAFVTVEGRHRTGATWEDVQKWNRDAQEFTGSLALTPGGEGE